MKIVLASFAILLALSLSPAASSAAESEACMAANAKLDAFLLAQPKTCQTNADCRPFYFRADSCAAPVILSAGVIEQQNVMLSMVELQMEARAACSKDWAARPACTPQVLVAVCRDGECRGQRPPR